MVKLFSDSKGTFYMTQDEFLEKCEDWISKDRDTWTHITLLSYFCYKYRQKNGVKFRFARWGGAPAKTKESRDFSKIIKAFLPEDFDELSKESKKTLKRNAMSKTYNYINWMFDYKFRTADKSITGTGLFLNHNMMNEFEVMWFKHQQKKKSESGFNSLKLWISDNHPEFLNSYDFEDEKDFKMILAFIEANNFSKDSQESAVLMKAKEMKIGV